MAKKAEKKAAPVSVKLSEHIDRELVSQALQKRRRGLKLTKNEARALSQFEQAKEETDRWRYYAAIPKKHWVKLSGKTHKTLGDHFRSFGVPVDGRTIDLGAVAYWLHQFLSDNARRLAAPDDGDLLLYGADSPALEKLRLVKLALLELDLGERQGSLLPRDLVHDDLMLIAGVIRGAGQILQRRDGWKGQEACDVVNEAIDEAEALIERQFAEMEETPCVLFALHCGEG
ncbi:MAG: hypothetical protein NTW96_25690 [Planctomycetia bacterium]|nr:hypothetical protein [Planctomycetia bacterium]